jgi:maltose-binding protein MalE
MFKRVLTKTVTAAAISAMVVSGFAGVIPSTTQASTTKTIKFWHGWSGAELTVLNQAIAKFEKENKGLKVEAVQVPFEKLQDKLKVALMGSTAPADVFIGPHDWEGVFGTMKGGVLADLNTTSLKSAFKSMKTSTVKAGKFKGKQIGFPESLECPVVIYNKNLVKTPPKTMEDLIKVAKANTKNGTYGLVTDKGNYYYQRAWYTALGGTEFTDEIKGTPAFGTKSFSDFLSYMRDLNSTGIIPKNCDFNTMMALFTGGKAAFMINGPWSFGDIEKSKMKGKWGIMNYPTVKGKVPHPFMGVKMFYIPKSSKNISDSAKFVKFMTSPDIQKLFNEKAGHIPANKATKVSDWKSKAVMDQAEDADSIPTIAEMSKVWTPVGDAMTKAMGTNASIKSMASEAATKIKTDISQMRGE